MGKVAELKLLASNMSVLYVEDSSETRNETTWLLKKFFAVVDVAKNGVEGLRLFESGSYDLIITDMLMPIMEGWDMIERIRERKSEQIIIIHTAYDYADFLKPKFPKGGDFFIPKPSSNEQMIETILAACERITVNEKA